MTQTKYHFIGIGGIGMSGLAKILLSKSQTVSGSDISTNAVTEGLKQAGAQIYLGHDGKTITPDMVVVYSSDIKQDNPEYVAALSHKCLLKHRSDMLNDIMQGQKVLAVAGTHGKTSTSALLTSVLHAAHYQPSYMVGGIVTQFQSNSGWGKGDYFVAEADESDGTFLKYAPYGAIVTNIDNDHMNHYGTDEELNLSFKKFMQQVSSSNHLVWCGDDERLTNLHPSGISYGFGARCQARLSNFRQAGWNVIYDLTFKGKHYSAIQVSLTGKHNALNSAAVFVLALQLGVPEQAIRLGLQQFKGVGRRAEKKGVVREIHFIDDYGHHPTEIEATIKAIRQAYGERRLVVVFQPHRYSRTKDCLGTFGPPFKYADEVILTDIYSAGEKPIAGLTHEPILAEISAYTHCQYVPRPQLAQTLMNQLRPHDVVLTIGAGDVTKVSKETLDAMAKAPPRLLKVGLVFGGRSNEHEVSLLSVKNIYSKLNRDLYQIELFGITKKGGWIHGPQAIEWVEQRKVDPDGIDAATFAKIQECDVMVPMLHGPYCEDGTLQGFFETLGKPYTGSDHRSSAICMDKVLAKKLVALAGVPTLPFIEFSKDEWERNPEEIVKAVASKLTYPVFVKPLHLGSTMGVHKVDQPSGLAKAVENALRLDPDVLIENGLDRPRELEFSVFGDEWPVTFPPGEILTHGSVYTYEGKYGANSIGATPQAELPESVKQEGMKLALKAYVATKCNGMARVDFFLDRAGKIWYNETNPIPGCTNNSLYPKICEANGIPPTELLDLLIILALHRHRKYASVRQGKK